jgi:hypothetical protein
VTTQTIAERSVLVAHLAEGPVTDLVAGYPYAESPTMLRLTRESLEAAGGQACYLGRAFAVQLDLLYLTDTGTTDGIPLGSHGTATVTFTGTNGAAIPAESTVKKAAVAALWSTGAASTIPVGLTRDLSVECETMGAVAAAIGTLDTVSPAISGVSAVTNAAEAAPGAAYAITLRILDRRTRSLVQSRSSLVETVPASGVYQITADPDQRSRLATYNDGNAGRLVLRWASADAQPPPVGLWDFELVVTHPGGAAVEARGLLEVLA